MPQDQFQRIAKALADPRRFEILERIAGCTELGCQELCGAFPVSQATISHHLKELATAGLVVPRREGQFVFCEARHDVIEAYIAELRRRSGRLEHPAPPPAAKPGRRPARMPKPAARRGRKPPG